MTAKEFLKQNPYNFGRVNDVKVPVWSQPNGLQVDGISIHISELMEQYAEYKIKEADDLLEEYVQERIINYIDKNF